VWNIGCSRKTGNASTFIFLRFFGSLVGRSLAILTVCYLAVRSISRVGCDSGRWNALSPTRWESNRGTALPPNICAFAIDLPSVRAGLAFFGEADPPLA
jgi:hypothetical protein